jgi:hypothetical protein
MDFGQIGEYVKAHPKAALGAASVAGIAVVYGMTKKKTAAKDSEDTNGDGTVADIRSPLADQPLGAPNTYANYPVLNFQVPDFRKPSDSTMPPTQFRTLQRNGKTVKVTAGPEGICGPGYVSAKGSDGQIRCTLVNDANKKPGQRQVYYPSTGKGAYIGK